jgi:hypothetical protein
MAFNVDQFRTQLAGDGARPNLFQVQLTIPNYIPGSGAAANKLTFMCTSASLPGSTIGQVSGLYYFGREVKIAGNRTYQDWSVQIINDEDFRIRQALEAWHYNINSPQNNVRSPNAAVVGGSTTGINVSGGSYGVDAYVTQYNKAGRKIYEYKFTGMWPTDVAPIELAWGTNDSIEEFGVTFAYQYWLSAGTSGTTSPV